MKTKNSKIADFVRLEFEKKADAQKAIEMAAYMKTATPFFGVQKPERIPVYRELKKRFKPEQRADYEANTRELWALPQREGKYTALFYAGAFPEYVDAESINLYADLIREGSWWDFVDDIAINLVGHAYRRDRRIIKKTIDKWTRDDDMWIRRTTLICHNHHKSETDQDQLFKTCLLLCSEKEFFIRKGMGWALREYSYVAPDQVKRFVTAHKDKLSPLTFREATKQLVRSGGWNV
jgi:3-methyladenine DNA glycosylase AlkD